MPVTARPPSSYLATLCALTAVVGMVLACLLPGPTRALAAGPAPPGPAPAAPGPRAIGPTVTGPTTSGPPLAGPLRVLDAFAPPVSPYGPGHRGVDLAAAVGDHVLAAAAGRVAFAGMLAGRGVLVVDHGGVRTTYEPVTAALAVGAQVEVGQLVGRVSAGTHCGTASCLHWGLRQGKDYLDPLSLVTGPQPAPSGPIRLLPAAARPVAQRGAAERLSAAAAARTSGVANLSGQNSSGGFGRPVPGVITSAFGSRFHPVLHVRKLHDGTDFRAACGTPIRAPSAGVVTRTGESSGYGRRLFLDHGQVSGRRVVTGYNHAASYVVGVGSRVARGQVLGYVGATGYATGCHLHLMLWLDDRLTNPMSWF